MLTIGAALAGAAERLAAVGVDGAEREAGWLLAHLLRCSAGALRLRRAEPLEGPTLERFAELVDRRARREPIQYILGSEEFLGLTFTVSPAVLIPRLDTAVLVSQAAELLAGRGPVRVADIGTGSGAIAVALAHLLPQASLVAVDLSGDALAVAAENAAANGVADRVALRQGDLLAPLEGEMFDAILSNPPYIGAEAIAGLMPEVRDWEPHLALTPGQDALAIYRRLVEEGPRFLRPGGLLGVEVGIGQADAVTRLFQTAGFVGLSVHRDTGGIKRAVFGSAVQRFPRESG